MWAWVPLFLVMGVIAYSFAGDRERHTLETLLASRLSNRAILLGKIAAAVGYALRVTLLSLAAGLVTVNVAHGRDSPATAGGILAVGFLGTLLAAAIDAEHRHAGPCIRYGIWASGAPCGVESRHQQVRHLAGPTRVLVFALFVVALVEFVARFHP